jgi:hypothetical protein
MLTTMARELVENKGIGESAASIWRNVQQLRPSTPAVVDQEHEERPKEQREGDVPAVLPITDVTLVAAASRRSTRRDTSVAQLSLF